MPLIEQYKISEKKNQDLQNEITQLKKSLKTIRAVVRTPMLCDLFHKTERKKLSEKEIKDADKDAH